MKKILIILEATLGGTRLHVIDQLDALIENKSFEVFFIYSLKRADKNFIDFVDKNKNENIYLNELELNREISPISDLINLLKIIKFIKKHKIDLVHGHSAKGGYIARLAAFITSTRSVYTAHASPFQISFIYRYLERFSSFFTDIIIANCKSEKEEMIENKIFPSRKIRVINSGIGDIAFKENLIENNKSSIIVGTVGRMEEQKAPMRFLRIAKSVSQLNLPFNIRFRWVGDGRLKEDMIEFIKKNNLEQFIVLVPWSENVNAEMNKFDIFLLTSEYESFGYVTLEAMRASKPCISTNITGSRDLIVNGETGYLIEKNNETEFVSVLKKLFIDPEHRNQLGVNGFIRWKNEFHKDKMNRELLQLYNSMLI